MNISDAIRLVREACALRHFSFKTEKTYTYWLGRYGTFLKERPGATATTEQKMEAFLSRLAKEGVSASTQNQAFNALLFFYRDTLGRQLGQVNSLRARQQGNPRHCPTPEEVRRLLAAVVDIYGYPTRLIVHKNQGYLARSYSHFVNPTHFARSRFRALFTSRHPSPVSFPISFRLVTFPQ